MLEKNNQVESESFKAQSVDNIQEAVSRSKVHDNQDQGDMAQLGPYPDRPGEPDCAYYLRTGSCGYGNNCRYNHPPLSAQVTQPREELPERVGQPDCGYYLRTGTCKYGSTCKYNHPKDRNGAGPVSFNTLGLPLRQDEKSCPHYMRTGNCKFGVACKFHHPEPLSYGARTSQSGLAAFGSTGSSVVPSMGVTYVGGFPSLSKSPYISNPYLQGLQTYMPIVFPPSQGLSPMQGWNTYTGSNLLYGTRNQGESGYDGQSHLLTSSNYSERTNQQHRNSVSNETGNNKYGSDGKYHNLKERTTQPVADAIGPHGLPLRPGLAVCSYYNAYGHCKFGPGCRFDHPFHGYPYGYGLSFSHLSMLDPSSLTYKQHTADTNAKTSADPPKHAAGSSQPQSSQASSKPSLS